MSSSRAVLAIRVGSLLCATALYAQTAASAVFPLHPTTNDDIYAVLKYPCPYPDPANPPVLIRNGNELLLEVTTEGTVCFDNAIMDKDHGFNIGKLPAGSYKLTVQHRYRLGNGQPSEFYWTNAAVRSFTVLDGISDRISGIWTSAQRSRDGMNITLLDQSTAFVVWNTNDPTGQPIWLYGTLRADGVNEIAGMMSFNRNLRFGDINPDPEATGQAWGTLRLKLDGCGVLRSSWVSTIPEYGSGSDTLALLANPRGVDGCLPEAIIPYGTEPVVSLGQ